MSDFQRKQDADFLIAVIAVLALLLLILFFPPPHVMVIKP